MFSVTSSPSAAYGASPASPSPHDIEALLRKYEEVLRLRRESTPGVGDAPDPRPALAALASEFPGALRELDQLPLEDVEARIARLRRVAQGDQPPERWMAVQARFHSLMRDALVAKRWLAGRKLIDATVEGRFRHELPSPAQVWAKDLAHIAAPPRGRVVEVVLSRVAEELGVDVGMVRTLMFGPESLG